MWFARGMCFFISDDAIAINHPVYRLLGQTKILVPGLTELAEAQGRSAPFVSIPVVVAIMLFLATMYIAHYTRFGRTLYAMGGYNGANEQSARLMGLPVDRTKVLVYTFSGFCSGLAGVAWGVFVVSGHGLYAQGFEMDVIASVVMGGTMLTGGEGYVFGTLFGVLILGITQTLIQFNGSLSSWWTKIVIGALTLFFIGVQSVLASRKRTGGKPRPGQTGLRSRRLVYIGSVAGVLVLAVLAFAVFQRTGAKSASTSGAACEFKPFRQDQAADLKAGGAILTYERNGGPNCIDELYAIYPDGRIVGDDGTNQVEKQITSAELEQLLAGIEAYGWFTDKMYDTWHTPCRQCYGYYLTVVFEGSDKTVKAVDGGTDAPADYWQVISLIKGVVPAIAP